MRIALRLALAGAALLLGRALAGAALLLGRALAGAALLLALAVPTTRALGQAGSQTAAPSRLRIVIVPKLVGIAYYDAVKQGVDAAARELPDMAITWTGPTQDRVEKQIDLIEQVLPSKPQLIAVAANDAAALGPVLLKAQRAGVRVISWDADSAQREFFVNLVDYADFGAKLVDVLVRETGPKGSIAVVTTSFTAPNQTRWIDAMKRSLYARYPGLRIVDIRPAGENTEEAYRVTRDYLSAYPDLKGIVALGVPNPPGVARAVRDAGQAGKVAVVGNSTPSLMREFLKDGTVKTVLLWNPQDHGYLTVYSARQLLRGGLKAGQPYQVGTLGLFTPRQDEVNLQVALPVLEFTKNNVDRFRF